MRVTAEKASAAARQRKSQVSRIEEAKMDWISTRTHDGQWAQK
jgi:hypothetical protein